MSCNGCRVLRKGCSDACVLRPCLQWIETPDAQGRATVFLAKFFGRAALMSFINAVPESQRPSLFRSLLYEACGRTVNPITGAVGLLSSGNWHACQAAVDAIFSGGSPELLIIQHPQEDQADAELCRSSTSSYLDLCPPSSSPATSPSGNSSDSATTCVLEVDACFIRSKESRLLNLFN